MTNDGVLDELLEDTVGLVRSIVAMDDRQATLSALWLGAAMTMPAYDVCGFLRVQSPLPGSGKTKLLELLDAVIGPRAIFTPNLTESVAFRLAATQDRVFLLDEVDVLLPGARSSERSEGLRGLFAAMWKRGTSVYRSKETGSKAKDYTPEEFKVFGLVALAGLATLPPTLADRSIPLILQRATEEERDELRDLLIEELDEEALPLRERWQRWATPEVVADLRTRRPERPRGLTGRQVNNVGPLMKIADRAGMPWPLRLHEAVASVYGQEDLVGRASFNALLVAGIARVFSHHPLWNFISTRDLLLELRADEAAPFARRYHGDPHSSRDFPVMASKLAGDLKAFGVFPTQRRVAEDVVRGYAREDLVEVFDRYAPRVTTVTAVTASEQTYTPLPFHSVEESEQGAIRWGA